MKKVVLYTVRIGDDSLTEFEKFYKNCEAQCTPEEWPSVKNLLNTLIQSIGDTSGAIASMFRAEGKAYALPPNKTPYNKWGPGEFGVRLYCSLVNENALILLNGGLKTERANINCPNICGHWRFADSFSNKLDLAISNERFSVKNGELLCDSEDELIIEV